jgi:Tfp pilus assembly protein PilZ
MPGETRNLEQPYGSLGSLLPVQVHAPTEDFLLLSYATNLSPESLFVLTSRPLPVGTEVLLNLQPHQSSERLMVKGRVHHFHSGPGPKGMEMSLQPIEEEEGSRKLGRLIARFFSKAEQQAV